ncbi:MAG: hypothetical protein GX421_05470 [Caldisericales bacterium]|nr:hypothetical protein [Caldisericales bacterium]
MLEKIGKVFGKLDQILRTSTIKLAVLLFFMTACAYTINQLLPRLSSLIAGNGWSLQGAPSQEWSQIIERITQRGLSEISRIGESVVAIKGLNALIEFLVYVLLLSALAGMAAFFVLETGRKGRPQLSSILNGFRAIARYAGGLSINLMVLSLAGLVGLIMTILEATPTIIHDSPSYVGWSFAVSASVIALSVLFVRLAYLPYIRCESSESLTDSLKYAMHLTRGNFWLVVSVMTPVVSGAMLLSRITRNIPVIATLGQQGGILGIVIVDVAMYMILSSKESAKAQKDGVDVERLG